MSYENHHDWLSLIEISGPFLAVPVLKESFPQGLEELDASKRKRLRQAYEEWREALELEDAQFAKLHVAWIDEVLSRGLELDEDGKGDVLKRAGWCAANLKANLPEHGVTLSPDLAVVDEQRANKPLLLIQTYVQHIDLDATLKQDGWAATPADRMVALCRSLGCRLGLVTNGERWMLVDAPVGAVTTFASWYARIWSQEPITLQAFVHLLGIRRFFVDESEQLPALFDRSLKFQDEVTDALGEQVRRAVEVLIQTLDKADQDRDRELLHDVKESELYEAALTVMMRLVFLLSAEERGLLLMGDERYEANYALSTLRMQLRKESEEILERRWDAWSRLLAIFRAVFGGIEHENLRLPALGGSLFDPDRFPFLEGRAKGSKWRSDAAKPLPIDNRTVLLLLEAIQQFQGRTLSYRALDVEQIGYVYEGLLERTVKRTDEVTLELDATKSAKAPWVKLAELDSARLDGTARLAELLQERSGSSASRVRNDLAKSVDGTLADRLLTACLGDTKLRDRIKPYAHLLRTDPWGYPLVYPAGAFIVTTGSDRRETGTHYTPKSLTEAIVTETLTPVAYVGPAEGTPRDQWKLKSPAELLDLKICDPAMGSGAFLVQACRWLSDRLVEAWSQAEGTGKTVGVDGEVLDAPDTKEPLPRDTEARTVIARCLIAERCLYGVDVNPLAVELAKLSIWLVTLAKGRPFGFLDHSLRHGDSLLGITALDQLNYLSMEVGKGSEKKLFAQQIENAVDEAVKLRLELRQCQILDISHVEMMANLDQQAREKLEIPELIADALVGEVLKSGGKKTDVTMLSIEAGQVFNGEHGAHEALRMRAQQSLNSDLPKGKHSRGAMHWCLSFPEVFIGENSGFDAIVGNPPFLGGKRISGALGKKYEQYLKSQLAQKKGAADFCAYFFLIARKVIAENKCIGFISTNTISQTDTRELGLARIAENSTIYRAESSRRWPGSAAVYVALVHIYSGQWEGLKVLNADEVRQINSYLMDSEPLPNAHSLKDNKKNYYGTKGTYVHGKGFLITPEEAERYFGRDNDNRTILKPYLVAKDFTSSYNHFPARWAIDFGDMKEEEAKKYSDLYSHVYMHVKPHRDCLKGQIHESNFWKFWDRRETLYEKISRLEKVIVCPEVSKYSLFSFVETGFVFSSMVNVIASDDPGVLACLQSSIHGAWSWHQGSTMKHDLRYTTSDCLDTFPFPEINSQLVELGSHFYKARMSLMESSGEGLTKLYNKVHDDADKTQSILDFRDLCISLDQMVMKAYGWCDLNLDYGFHNVAYLPEGKNTRYTFSEAAREEILYRLVMLNKERHESEEKGAAKKIPTRANHQSKVRSASWQGSLFDQEKP